MAVEEAAYASVSRAHPCLKSISFLSTNQKMTLVGMLIITPASENKELNYLQSKLRDFEPRNIVALKCNESHRAHMTMSLQFRNQFHRMVAPLYRVNVIVLLCTFIVVYRVCMLVLYASRESNIVAMFRDVQVDLQWWKI